MKKFIYSIMMAALPVMAISLASCDNDDDLPDVSISLSVDGGTISDGTIYVVEGETLNITGVNVKNNDGGKAAGVTNVAYYLDDIFLGRTNFSPFGMDNVITEEYPAGNYTLTMTCTVLAVDKTIAQGVLTYNIKVVANEADVPGGSDTDTTAVSLK